MGFLKTYVLTTQDGLFVCRTLEDRDVKEFGKRIHSDGGFVHGVLKSTWVPVGRVERISALGDVRGMKPLETKAVIEYSKDREASEGIESIDWVVKNYGGVSDGVE